MNSRFHKQTFPGFLNQDNHTYGDSRVIMILHSSFKAKKGLRNSNSVSLTVANILGTRGFFSRAMGSFVSSTAGRNVFVRRPKTRAAHEKPLAPRVGCELFYTEATNLAWCKA